MESWVLYALLSAGFAGVVGVTAKAGMSQISGDLALAIRTAVIFLLVVAHVAVGRYYQEASRLSPRDWGFLAFSGAATMLSWLCYYRAVKLGPVSGVALLDKSSVLITVLLAIWLLGEPLTWRVLVGGGLIVAGFLVLTLK
ncbi:EamA family transporter [Chitiniphilus eburneus]|uniref:EamA family transporter n=1 Tax=Chitiniphilus eburneus TaxID=2571148 RepID=A0A4U0PTK3_9NEIS|nr:EamA family transporter [Chitiniphilus eburneus]TJZ71715.1 EamA family transporter [Chitiniphilus eburneus]